MMMMGLKKIIMQLLLTYISYLSQTCFKFLRNLPHLDFSGITCTWNVKKKRRMMQVNPPPPSFLMFVNISPMLSAWLLLPLSWRSVFVIGWTLNQIPVKVWLWSIYIFFLNLWLPRNVHHYFPDFVTSSDQDIGVRRVYLWFPVSQQY